MSRLFEDCADRPLVRSPSPPVRGATVKLLGKTSIILHEVHSFREEPYRFPDRDVIGADHREKLRKCIMNLDSANNVDELLGLTIARA